jgi:uncharacterized membrane protein
METKMPQVAPHIEETVRAIARLHADHQQRATRIDRATDRATAFLGHPSFLGVVTLVVIFWVGANLGLQWIGRAPIDAPPFPWLGQAITLMALYMAGLILMTQRRADDLAGHREQMTLELSILSEQKAAKIIELIEELRQDSPQIRDRVDDEALAMATRADPHAMLEAIEDTHKEMLSSGGSEAESGTRKD